MNDETLKSQDFVSYTVTPFRSTGHRRCGHAGH